MGTFEIIGLILIVLIAIAVAVAFAVLFFLFVVSPVSILIANIALKIKERVS